MLTLLISHRTKLIHLLILSLYSFGFAAAAERDLFLDVTGTGPFPVGSTNFTLSSTPAGETAVQNMQGANNNGTIIYISDLLANQDASFTFQLAVPDEPSKYGASAGTNLPYTGYVLYPTTEENTRADYQVITLPALPHMQGPTDLPIFADESEKYPLIVYSHGVSGHPTDGLLDSMIVLASHGYIVMGLYHGDGRFGLTEARQFNLRPLAVKTAIDELLARPEFLDHIDSTRIGGVGQSFGGATMLALLGAKRVNPDFVSVATDTLTDTTVDSRILAAATIVPYAGLSPYSLFGRSGSGAATVDRPFMANSAQSDTVAEYAKIEAVIEAIPGVKYLVGYEGEDHDLSLGASEDADTWTKLFLDAFIKKDATAIEELSRIRSVNGGGKDTLIAVTEPSASLPPVTEVSPATFEDNVLRIPSIAVLDQYYSLNLNYIVDSNPVQFGLVDITELEAQPETNASFENGVLIVPKVSIAGVDYRVELTLVSESPALFTLTFAE